MQQQHQATSDKDIYISCRDGLVAELQRQYRAGSFSTLSFSSDVLLTSLYDMVKASLFSLPDFSTVKANSQFIKQLRDLDAVQLLHARENFDKGLLRSLTSSDTIKAALKQFTDSLEAHREEMMYWAIIAPIAGSSAFVIGTVCQIVCDFLNTIVSLLSFAWKAMSFTGRYVYNAVAGEEEGVSIDISVIRELVPDIDLEKFFMEDIPVFIDEVMAFGVRLVNDYAANAETWGKDTGDYILAVAGNSFNTAFSLFFEPMNPNDDIITKAWWAVKQWYYMGTMIGPMIVDIVLFFCSGSVSGYFSAANKLGKVTKIGELFKAFEYFSELKKLSIIRVIASKWEESKILRELVEKIYNALINLALGAGEKLRTLVQDVYKMVSKADDMPEVEVVMEKIDELYDKAQNLDFFLGTILLLAGAEFDQEGELTLT